MRLDYSVGDSVHTEDFYYIIEEYHSKTNKWVGLNHFYLPEYEYGEFTACGRCWQESDTFGCYDLEYAKEYCNKLNDALYNGTIQGKGNVEVYGITGFRICECEKVFKKKPLVAYKY